MWCRDIEGQLVNLDHIESIGKVRETTATGDRYKILAYGPDLNTSGGGAIYVLVKDLTLVRAEIILKAIAADLPLKDWDWELEILLASRQKEVK